MKNKKIRTRNMKIIKKLSWLGKHTVKITDQPLTQLVGRMKDKGSKMSYIKSSKVNDNS